MDRINENKEYARVRTNKDCTRPAYQFHVSCIYDLINERYCDAYIEPFRTHSETLVFSVMLERKNFPQKALFIADRGYESYLLMAQIQHDGNYFLIRTREDFGQGSMIKGYPFPRDGTFDKTVTYIYTKTQNKRTKANPELYKRVATRNSPYFINKEHPYVKMTLRFVMIVLPNGQKECLITNLPANKFPPETLKKLYCIRWKIETSFRLIKYSANLLEFHSKKIEFLQQEIWAKMIFYNFTTTITQHLRYKRDRGKYQYKPNMTNALQMCKDYLRNAKTLTNRCLFKPFHLLSHTRKPTYKSESVYTNHCIMFPLHLVFNLLLKILHDLLWLIIFPIRNHKIKDHIRMCWPFDHSKVMN